MAHFILRYRAGAKPPTSDVERIHQTYRLKVVDSSSKMLLVDATPEAVHQLVQELAGWVFSADRTVRIPDTKPKLTTSG